ncbi:MAG: helix-turn-helix transcriptional regulator [Acidobacteriaceae bacterium]
MTDGMTPDPVIFTSWKEIASYLGKGVRTVQRWEAQFGLPVQRPNSRAKGIVRASRAELDEWIATRWSPRTKEAALPSLPVASLLLVGVDAGVDASQDLRMRSRVLLKGLQRTVEELKKSCEELAVTVTNCEFRRNISASSK